VHNAPAPVPPSPPSRPRFRSLAAGGALGIGICVGLVAGACSTGVEDIEGWRKAVARDYSCSELREIADGLPASVDRDEVDADLRRKGC
jgi:hypothetical protein